MQSKIILVTGGSRSGKSEFAEKLVKSFPGKCAYIATAEVLDEEMRFRVDKHRSRRKSDFWINYEAPLNAHEIIDSLPKEANTILFDCLTIYITNLIFGKDYESLNDEDKHKKLVSAMKNLLEAMQKSGKTVVIVTNEVGSGIVPLESMSRDFRDLAGYANQLTAEISDEVYLVICGIAVELKKIATELKSGESINV